MVNGVNRKNLVRGLIVMGLIAAMGAFFSGCDNGNSDSNETPITAEFLMRDGGFWDEDSTWAQRASWRFISPTEVINQHGHTIPWEIINSNTIGIFGFGDGLDNFRITIIHNNRIRATADNDLSMYMNRQPE